MADRQQPPQDWIALGAASRLLGVDPATLRRWAAAGRVESYRTPGGHRRFSRAVVERIRTTRSLTGARVPARARPERVAAAYMRRVRSPATPVPGPWMATLDPATVAAFRERGRRLVTILVGILDRPVRSGAPEPGETPPTVADLERAAREQGAETARSGLPLVEALGVVLAMRQPLLAELAGQAGRRRLSAADTGRLVVRGGDLLNRYLLAHVEGYLSAAALAAPAADAAVPPADAGAPARVTADGRTTRP